MRMHPAVVAAGLLGAACSGGSGGADTTEDFPHTMIRWADNIVLATRYIGPVRVE